MTPPLGIQMLSRDFLPFPGGVAAHVDGLARALCRRGHRVDLVQPAWSALPAVKDLPDGLTLHRVRVPRLPVFGAPWYAFRVARCLNNLARVRPASVLHWHTLEPDASAARRSTVSARVFTNHTSDFLVWMEQAALRRQATAALRGARWVIAPSAELARATADAGFPESRIAVIANGVNTEVFQPDPRAAALRRELDIAPDAFLFLCARRLESKNGVRFWAEALPLVVAGTSRPVHFLFIGDFAGIDSDREAVRKLLQHPALSGRVTFLGAVDHQLMPRYCAAADAAVLPSLREATSLAGLEAMASGLPLIGTRVGGIPEIVDDGRTGLLVEPAQPAALAHAALRLMGRTDWARALGAAARESCLRRFSWDAIAQQTEDVYALALADDSGFAF